mgnify:CR=1 FL=1
MIQIIAGKKGKGKTKHLLDKVNAEVKEVHGNIVYLDKSSKHMYELNNKVRLIDTSEFGLSSSDGFIGFICGIISQDHDLEQMYLWHYFTGPRSGADVSGQLSENCQTGRCRYHRDHR